MPYDSSEGVVGELSRQQLVEEDSEAVYIVGDEGAVALPGRSPANSGGEYRIVPPFSRLRA